MSLAESDKDQLALIHTQVGQVAGFLNQANELLGEIQSSLLLVGDGTNNPEAIKAISLAQSIRSNMDLHIAQTYLLGASVYQYGNSL